MLKITDFSSYNKDELSIRENCFLSAESIIEQAARHKKN